MPFTIIFLSPFIVLLRPLSYVHGWEHPASTLWYHIPVNIFINERSDTSSFFCNHFLCCSKSSSNSSLLFIILSSNIFIFCCCYLIAPNRIFDHLFRPQPSSVKPLNPLIPHITYLPAWFRRTYPLSLSQFAGYAMDVPTLRETCHS